MSPTHLTPEEVLLLVPCVQRVRARACVSMCVHARVPSVQASVCSLSAIKRRWMQIGRLFLERTRRGSQREGWVDGGMEET